MTTLASFIAAIATSQVASLAPARLVRATGEERALDRLAIAAAESAARRDAPGTPPAADAALMEWAWGVLYHGAALVVHRALGPDEIRARLGAAPPSVADAAVAAWSADVAFRHLGDLHRIAAAVSAGDPLALALADLGVSWPLSGVGFATVPPPGDARLAPVLAHPALRRLYVDRVLAQPERGRFADPVVAVAARAALGGHGAMLPRALAALAPPPSPPPAAVTA